MQCVRPHQEGRARPSLFFVSDSIGLFNGLGRRTLSRFGCRAGRAGHLQRARKRVALHRMGFGRPGIAGRTPSNSTDCHCVVSPVTHGTVQSSFTELVRSQQPCDLNRVPGLLAFCVSDRALARNHTSTARFILTVCHMCARIVTDLALSPLRSAQRDGVARRAAALLPELVAHGP